MAWGAILGGLLGAGGSVAGGMMGGAAGGQGRTVQYSPALDYAMQVAQYSSLDPLGFGNINTIPGPIQQLISSLRTTPMSDKTREAVFKSLAVIQNNPELLDDPGGHNYSAEQIRGFLRDPSTLPPGRRIPEADRLPGGNLNVRNGELSGAISNSTNPLPLAGLPSLKKILRGQGMGVQDLRGLLEEQAAFDAEIQKLKDAGLGGLQTNTILNRATAANAASQLLGDAGRFVQGGDPSSLQTQILNQINRSINDQEEAIMLRSQFGGYNPSAGLEGIGRMREDATLTAMNQAIAAANALTASLGAGTEQAQRAAGLSSGATTSAMGIAAQQAAAANQLRQNAEMNRGESIANGISGAANYLGGGLMLGAYGAGGGGGGGYYGGPGSTANQYATMNSQYGGWNPVVDFGSR